MKMALQSLPRDDELRYMRSLLFNLPLPFSLTLATHDIFWPFVDNIYSITKTRQVTAGHTVYYVICRLKAISHKRADESTSAKLRQSRKRVQSCNAEFRILRFHDYVEY